MQKQSHEIKQESECLFPQIKMGNPVQRIISIGLIVLSVCIFLSGLILLPLLSPLGPLSLPSIALMVAGGISISLSSYSLFASRKKYVESPLKKVTDDLIDFIQEQTEEHSIIEAISYTYSI